MTAGHQITVESSTQHVHVERNGQVLADSRNPLVLREEGYPVRYYLPPEDVRLDLLAKSDTTTRCPFKGLASYWSLPDAPDLVWAYEKPKAQVDVIKGYYCFADPEVTSD